MEDIEWVVIDTETSGLASPVHVIEIAAQRMRGWEKIGSGFRYLLNHNVNISPFATAVHGYTKQYISQHGIAPRIAYEQLRLYIEDRSIVSYILPFYFDRVLINEWTRLGIAPIGKRGFCALRLAKALLDPSPTGDHKLQTLRQHFRLPERRAHSALGDVETTIDLLQSVLWPIARQRGLVEWDVISKLGGAS